MGYVSDVLDPERKDEQDLDEAWNSLGGNMNAKDAAKYLSEYVSGNFEVEGNSLLYSDDSFEGFRPLAEVNLKYEDDFLAVKVSKAEDEEGDEVGSRHQDGLNARHLLIQMEERMDYNDHRRVVPEDGTVYGSFTEVENFDSSAAEVNDGP